MRSSLKRKRNLLHKNNNNGEKQSTATVTVVRRSARKANKPALYTGQELDRLHVTENGGQNSSSLRRKIKQRKFDLGQQISKDKRMLFSNEPVEEWIEDMKYYFMEYQGNSERNVTRTASVVIKLVSGMGVRHPQTGKYFKKNVKIQLSDDFSAMLNEASEWVHNNGGDRGHGWMIEHPVKKCFIYQHARAKNGGTFLTKAKS